MGYALRANPPYGRALTVIPGREQQSCERTRNLDMFSAKQFEIPGCVIRLRRLTHPGMTAHIKCTACGANNPMIVKPTPATASRPDTQASAIMPVMMVAEASTMPIWNAAEATS